MQEWRLYASPPQHFTLVRSELTMATRRANDPEKWVRRENAFEAVVSRDRFDQAASERKRRRRQWTDDEMLDALLSMFIEHGKVTPALIDAGPGPAAKSYAFRFNGLISAMGLAGVSWPSIPHATITRNRLRCVTRDMTNELVRCMTEVRAEVEAISPRTWRVRDITVRLLCTRCRYERGHPCWKVTLVHNPAVDFVIWVRMDQSNERPNRCTSFRSQISLTISIFGHSLRHY